APRQVPEASLLRTPPERGRSQLGQPRAPAWCWVRDSHRGRFGGPWNGGAPAVQIGRLGGRPALGWSEVAARISERDAQVKFHVVRNPEQCVDPLQDLGMQGGRDRANAERAGGQHQVLYPGNDRRSLSLAST